MNRGEGFFRDRKNKRGQITIFIIIGILIVALAGVIYVVFPDIRSDISETPKTPSEFIQTCMKNDIENTIETISLQGGNYVPEHYIMYQGNPVSYLCYTNQDYLPCVVQQALLKSHVENEIKSQIQDSIDFCFKELETSYIDKGYSVDLREGDTSVELLPKRIKVSPQFRLILTKGETETYDNFDIILNNNLYELISITNSIISWEAEYGDAETTTYMNYYHDLKVEKHKQDDGTKIYILTDRNTRKKFQFATRSMAFPAGLI